MAKLQEWPHGREFALTGALHDPPEIRSGTTQRRRIVVFTAVFFVASAVTLADAIFRPAEYRAVSRLEIVPASARSPADDRGAGTAEKNPPGESSSKSFLREVQVLTSRPLLEEVVARLANSRELPEGLGTDPVQGLQHMLNARAVEGTKVVHLQA